MQPPQQQPQQQQQQQQQQKDKQPSLQQQPQQQEQPLQQQQQQPRQQQQQQHAVLDTCSECGVARSSTWWGAGSQLLCNACAGHSSNAALLRLWRQHNATAVLRSARASWTAAPAAAAPGAAAAAPAAPRHRTTQQAAAAGRACCANCRASRSPSWQPLPAGAGGAADGSGSGVLCASCALFWQLSGGGMRPLSHSEHAASARQARQEQQQQQQQQQSGATGTPPQKRPLAAAAAAAPDDDGQDGVSPAEKRQRHSSDQQQQQQQQEEQQEEEPLRPPPYEQLSRNVCHQQPRRGGAGDVSVCECDPRLGHTCSEADGCINAVSRISCTPGRCPVDRAAARAAAQAAAAAAAAGAGGASVAQHGSSSSAPHPRCSNMVLATRRGLPALRVAHAGPAKGWGVVAGQGIAAGRVVAEYLGEVLPAAEGASRLARYAAEGLRHTFVMEFSGTQVIDATRRGGVARFINHSCDPNCEAQKWQVGSQGERVVAIVAARDIAAGEEVTYDYRLQGQGLAGGRVRCACGAPTCRGWLGRLDAAAHLAAELAAGAEEERARGAPLGCVDGVTGRVSLLDGRLRREMMLEWE